MRAPRIDVRFERRTLLCGATLITASHPTLPLFTVQAHLDAGHLVESPGEDGILALAARLLVVGGAGDRDGRSLTVALENAGIRYASSTGGVRLQAFGDQLELVGTTIAACLTRPRFDAEVFEVERARLESELRSAESNPRQIARQAFMAEIYGAEHPYGRPARGRADDVASFARERVVARHLAEVSPRRLIFAAAGAFDVDALAGILDRELAGLPTDGRPRPVLPEIAIPPQGREHFIVRKKEKLHVYAGHLGIRRNDPDFLALVVLDQILGGGSGFTNRLARRIRDQLGLAYTVGGGITDSAGREPGVFSLYAGTFPDRYEAVVAAMRQELEVLLVGGVTAEEVDSAKQYLFGSFLFDTETNQHLVDLATGIVLHDLGLDHPQRFADGIDRVTPDQVLAAARAHLHPDRLVVVGVGRRAPPPSA